MGRQIRFTKTADKRFDEILEYLNVEFGPTSVDRFLERTYSFFDILVDFPQIGKLDDKHKGIYGFVLEKQVTVFYRFNDKEIILLNFYDNRSKPKKRK